MRDGIDHGLDQRVHLLDGVRSPQRKANARACLLASSGPWPSRTCDGSTAPLEQAAPLDTANPLRSSAISRASLSIPSKRILVVLGVRGERGSVHARIRDAVEDSCFQTIAQSGHRA